MAAIEINKATGLRNLEIYYEPVQNRDFGSTIAYRSILRINDPSLGVLLPERYRDIADRSYRCEKLFKFTLETVLEDISRLNNKDIYCEWISVYLPVRMLVKPELVDNISSLLGDIEPKQICFEIPETILSEDSRAAMQLIDKLSAAGFRTMLSSFGGQYCPIMRLAGFKFDFVSLENSVSKSLYNSSEAEFSFSISVFELIESLGSVSIATGIISDEAEDALPDNCSLITGANAGKPKKISAIRN